MSFFNAYICTLHLVFVSGNEKKPQPVSYSNSYQKELENEEKKSMVYHLVSAHFEFESS